MIVHWFYRFGFVWVYNICSFIYAKRNVRKWKHIRRAFWKVKCFEVVDGSLIWIDQCHWTIGIYNFCLYAFTSEELKLHNHIIHTVYCEYYTDHPKQKQQNQKINVKIAWDALKMELVCVLFHLLSFSSNGYYKLVNIFFYHF